MKQIVPSDDRIQYMGRVDMTDPDAPVFYWAGSLLQCAFTGANCTILIENHRSYNGLQIGYILDGRQYQLQLCEQNDVTQRYELPVDGNGLHHLTVFKRQDSTHYYKFHGLELAMDGDLQELPSLPNLKLECYGDSVTAGSVVEAVDCVGQSDPPVYDSVYDNAWHSYAMQTARLLQAQVHLVAQGGIALLDNTGYYDNGKYGMMTAYDKLCYVSYHEMTPWDFSRYIPDVVTMAIGQNDQHFDGQDRIFTPEEREHWLDRYCDLLTKLMARYPKAVFVLFLTVLMHDDYWEGLLDEACARMQSERVKRFRFSRSGKATPGHPRIPEQCEMACELTEFIRTLI